MEDPNKFQEDKSEALTSPRSMNPESSISALSPLSKIEAPISPQSQLSKIEIPISPQSQLSKIEIPFSPQPVPSKIEIPTISKPNILKLEVAPSPQPRTTKAEILTSPQSLAAKLEAKLDPVERSRNEAVRLDDSRNEANRLDNSRNERSEREAEDDRTNESESEDDNDKITARSQDDDDVERNGTANDENETVRIDIKSDDEGENTPTLPMNKKKEKGQLDDIDRPHKKKPPIYLFPITRMNLAWTKSSNMCEFLLRAILIIFSTLGWLFCIGGVPFVSLVMLIMGSIFIDDCNIEPNIPVYLIVSGVLGTIQHVIAIWTKYVPKDAQGRMKKYRSYCICFDNILHLFLAIWFVIGCIWVYGVYDRVEYDDTYKDEYCHKTLYLFSFWVFNFSFIILSLVFVFSLCWIITLAISS